LQALKRRLVRSRRCKEMFFMSKNLKDEGF